MFRINQNLKNSSFWVSLLLTSRPATLLKKRLWHSCFPVNFAKFLRTPPDDCCWSFEVCGEGNFVFFWLTRNLLTQLMLISLMSKDFIGFNSTFQCLDDKCLIGQRKHCLLISVCYKYLQIYDKMLMVNHALIWIICYEVWKYILQQVLPTIFWKSILRKLASAFYEHKFSQ